MKNSHSRLPRMIQKQIVKIGKADSDITAGSSGTVSIWRKNLSTGILEDTGEDIEDVVYDWRDDVDITAGDEVFLAWFADERVWRIVELGGGGSGGGADGCCCNPGVWVTINCKTARLLICQAFEFDLSDCCDQCDNAKLTLTKVFCESAAPRSMKTYIEWEFDCDGAIQSGELDVTFPCSEMKCEALAIPVDCIPESLIGNHAGCGCPCPTIVTCPPPAGISVTEIGRCVNTTISAAGVVTLDMKIKYEICCIADDVCIEHTVSLTHICGESDTDFCDHATIPAIGSCPSFELVYGTSLDCCVLICNLVDFRDSGSATGNGSLYVPGPTQQSDAVPAFASWSRYNSNLTIDSLIELPAIPGDTQCITYGLLVKAVGVASLEDDRVIEISRSFPDSNNPLPPTVRFYSQGTLLATETHTVVQGDVFTLDFVRLDPTKLITPANELGYQYEYFINGSLKFVQPAIFLTDVDASTLLCPGIQSIASSGKAGVCDRKATSDYTVDCKFIY